jgi:recombination protein RecT
MANEAHVQDSSGKIVRQKDAVQSIQDMLERNKTQIAMALPEHVKPERMIRVVVTSLRRVPALTKCSVPSLISCIFQAAQLGLEVDNGLGHAYLIPFGQECTLIVGYKGMVDLARRSGQVSTIKAVAVHKGDFFEWEEGLSPKLIHKPKPDNHKAEIVFVYAVCKLRDGSSQFEVMSFGQIKEIQAKSRSGKSGPWVSNFEEMAKKTVIRRLFKMMPVSVEIQRAVSIDEQQDSGVAQLFDTPTEDFAAMLVSGAPDNALEAGTRIDPDTGEVLKDAAPAANGRARQTQRPQQSVPAPNDMDPEPPDEAWEAGRE